MQHQTLTFVHRTVPDAPLVEDERQDPYAVTVVEPVFGEVYDETYSTGHFAHEPGHLVVIPRGRLDTREEMMAEVLSVWERQPLVQTINRYLESDWSEVSLSPPVVAVIVLVVGLVLAGVLSESRAAPSGETWVEPVVVPAVDASSPAESSSSEVDDAALLVDSAELSAGLEETRSPAPERIDENRTSSDKKKQKKKNEKRKQKRKKKKKGKKRRGASQR